MTAEGLAKLLGAEILAEGNLEGVIRSCLVCDVISQAMAGGRRGMAWITVQANMNALAASVMTDAACLIFPAGIRPEEDVLQRAQKENVTLLAAAQSAFDLAGRMYEAGLRGEEQ